MNASTRNRVEGIAKTAKGPGEQGLGEIERELEDTQN